MISLRDEMQKSFERKRKIRIETIDASTMTKGKNNGTQIRCKGECMCVIH